jgi:ketosteroid isomerase-like protein
MKYMKIVILSLLLSLLATYATAAENGARDLEEAHGRMAAALQAGDAQALADCYTKDARLSFPLRPDIIGRNEIQRQMDYVIGLGVHSFHIIQDDLFAGDEWILQSGTCIFYNEGGQEFNRSRFISIWHLEDGRWRIHRDFVV